MKNKIAISTITSGLLLSAGPTFAFDTGKAYVGAQYAMFSFENADAPDFDPTGLIIRGGYFFNKYFSLEGRLGFGIGDDSIDDSGLNYKVELDNVYGVYGVGHIPVSERVDLYGVLGYSKGESTLTITEVATGLSGSVSEDDSDLSMGVGADFLLTDAFSINIEYMSYISKSEFDTNALSLGFNYYF